MNNPYAVYPYPNRAVVKALYTALRLAVIDRAEFAACLKTVMGAHR